MRCQNCAGELTTDSLYCPRCGTVVDQAASAASLSSSSNADPADGSVAEDGLSGRALTGILNRERALMGVAGTSGALTAQADGTTNKRLDAYSVHNLLAQANLHRMRGQFTESVDCCVAVLRVQPGNATAHSLLGDIYRDQDKLDDAIQWYRMALELRPNPADQSKLSATERQRRNTAGTVRAQRTRMAATGPDSLAAATGLNTGTSNLMGVSPRRWLRGIWITSLSFLTIVIVALIAMQSQRHEPAPRAAGAQAGSGGFGGGFSASALPPLDLNHRAANPPLQSTGNGQPATQLPRIAQSIPGQTIPPAAAPNTPPAPVLDVRPLDSGTTAVGQAPRDTGPAAAAEPLQPMPLTGNLVLEQVQNLGNSTAAVIVTAPRDLATDSSDAAKELLVRNVFRAARTAFARSSLYTRATVFIQTQIPAAGGVAVLMEASVDRTAAVAAAPETDTLENLMARLQALKWAAQAAASGASPADIPGQQVTVQPGR